jgi:uncharacterized phage-associated protein
MASALEVARYFAHIAANYEEPAYLTNLHIQKFLYYAQGFHLAMHSGDPLFSEPIIARQHGPVVPEVYEIYRVHGKSPIEVPGSTDPQDYAPEVRELLESVYKVYGQFSAWKLSDMTHVEPPWKQTPLGQEISRQLLREFFERLVEAGRKDQSVDNEPVWPTNSFQYQGRREIMKLAPRRDRIRRILARVPSPDPWASDAED